MDGHELMPPPPLTTTADTTLFDWELNIKEPFLMTCAFTCSYTALHLLSRQLMMMQHHSKYILSTQLKSLADRVYLPEKVCSSVNGLVTGVSGLYLLMHPSHFIGVKGVFDCYPKFLHLVFSSYVGYSIYDMGTMVIVGNEHYSMWMHHLVGAVGGFLTMVDA